jgi:hypothetical protein
LRLTLPDACSDTGLDELADPGAVAGAGPARDCGFRITKCRLWTESLIMGCNNDRSTRLAARNNFKRANWKQFQTYPS